MSQPERRYSAEETKAIEIGTDVRAFLATAGGQWLRERLDGRHIASEALMAPSKDYTLDYYRGRVAELTSLLADLEARVVAADAISEDADDEFESYEGPQIGSGSPALGDFGR